MRLLVVGGSDAAISAALRAREVDPAVDVHLIVADSFPNFSICGLPFYLSGEISDWRTLAHRSRQQIESAGIQLHLNETAIAINPTEKTVVTKSADVNTYTFDQLVIGTGAVPVRPPIEGVDSPQVFVLHTMEDCFALHRRLAAGVGSAIIIGAGYIGLEMADALRHRGIAVTLIEQLPAVMRTVDRELAGRVESLLREHEVAVKTQTVVARVVRQGEQMEVQCTNGYAAVSDIVLLVVGVRPQSDLAKSCGVETDSRGAIIVDRGMRTNRPGIFAAGDCTVTWHRLLERHLYMPLGSTSHKQGRVAGENALGGSRLFAGSLGTQSVKLFDRVIAATGLREEDARSNGYDALAVETKTFDHKVYYPGATEMIIRIIADRLSGKLLGGQILGAYGKEVSKRIDVLATAIHHGMSVEELSDLDLSYTPPLSSPWDPVQMAAQAWTAMRNRAAQ
jgi:NADPH-dependent 2,4-dienoyl-CoA reductase/sulfur reductase-like enzyme